MAVMEEYLWIAVVGTASGFVYAFGIGANDVANSFASTVSSKSLTLKQAVIVAGIFEFLGAILLGASVTSTIRSKIFDISLYENDPEIVLLGMMTSIVASTFLLLIATYFGLPVSTTHTVVGAIMGFSICARGFSSIAWDVAIKIFISWVVSPLVAGLIAFGFFVPLRWFVLRHDNAYHRAYLTFPIVLFIGVGIDLFYVLYKAGKNFNAKEALPLSLVLPVSFGVGLLCGILWLRPVGPVMMRRINARLGEPEEASTKQGDEEKADVPESALEPSDDATDSDAKDKSDEEQGIVPNEEEDEPQEQSDDEDDSEEQEVHTGVPSTKKKKFYRQISSKFAEKTFDQDLHKQSMHENPKAASIWEAGEQFDPHAEQLFTYVQVFTACLNAFAHGANDVSNAIAPISAIIAIYQTGELSSKAPVQKWILAYGAVGIVLGLLLYGYKVMKSLGFKVTIISPSRGACAELAASLFVVTASFLGIPVSSTQSIVGGVTGVGVAGGCKNVQWLFLLRVCLGWVGVFFASLIVSAGVFSFCAFSPSLVPGE